MVRVLVGFVNALLKRSSTKDENVGMDNIFAYVLYIHFHFISNLMMQVLNEEKDFF